MITLKKNEWERMKRPIYPQIEFASNQDNLQIQSMVRLDMDGEYYKPVILLNGGIREIDQLRHFLDVYDGEVERVRVEEVTEEDTLLYKIEEDE